MKNFVGELQYFMKYPRKQLDLWSYKLKKHRVNYYSKVPNSFAFNPCTKPSVIIIIPVYNNYNWTLKCLYSIKKNIKNIDYKIIIADDCSTDKTKVITKYIKNIEVIRTSENGGFLKNCNNALKNLSLVGGGADYIWLLNNDTQVLPGALESMLDVFNKHDDAGAVGSKLIYPNGLLQEAGGIIYKDATGCNYGRMRNRLDAEYNYLKEVDYCSGASLLLKKSIMDELGGFDERFAPAYYEETDLCFRIREKGYKVYYQPFSEVVHFESISLKNSHDELMKINRNKFITKWHDVLLRQCDSFNDNFLARERSQNKKIMLVLDSQILKYDTNCGQRSTFHYIKMFVDKGMSVKFMPLNQDIDLRKDCSYLEVLANIGIETIIDDPSRKKENFLQNWFRDNGRYLDYIFINRPEVWEYFYILIKDFCPKAKLIYQGHDIHFLREERLFSISPSEELKSKINSHKNLEVDIWKKADLTWYFSPKEIDIIKNMYPCANAMAVPLYLYDTPEKVEYNGELRSDLLFVGGFKHTPNLDAMEWFINEIFPTVSKKLPGIKLHIVGSNPPKSLRKIANSDIIIHGFVSDEKLEELYKSTKLVISPLRYGAGIKGKIIEAMMFQIPVITTSIGAEGIDSELLTIADSSNEFIEKLITIYSDNDKLNTISNNSLDFVKTNYTKAVINKFVDDWFNIKTSK